MGSYDYANYFNSFGHPWTKLFLLHVGLLQDLVQVTLTSIHRLLKRGNALSQPFVAYNGYGQGNVLSFMHAFLVISQQFKMLDAIHPWAQTVDDRNFKGSLEDILKVGSLIHEFDKLAMQQPLHDKTAFLLTDE